MRREATGMPTILCVSPDEEDYSSLERIICHSRWLLLRADGLPAARDLLHRQEVSVVLCDSNLGPASWIDLLDHLRDLRNSPSLVVTSRLADERLWSEALNLGAWDVLAKPFDRSEVIRSVKSAWDHWYRMVERDSKPMRVMAAAS